MNGDDKKYSTALETSQSGIQVDDVVAEGIRKAAPFYEAWPVLTDWLAKNGIALGDGGSMGWRAMDMRPDHKGKPFPQTFSNLSEALTFALEHCKQHIETEAARDE